MSRGEAAAESTAAEAGRIVRRLDIGMVLRVAGLLATVAALAFGGYWMRRHGTMALGAQVSLALGSDPDAAQARLTLMRNNDVRAALDRCHGSAVWIRNGLSACRAPMWLDGPGAAP